MLLRFPSIAVVALLVTGCGTADQALMSDAEEAFIEGRLSEALQKCNEILAQNPKDYDAWILRGQIHQDSGDLRRAEADFAEAVEIDPGGAVGRFYQAELQNRKRPSTTSPAPDPSPSSTRTVSLLAQIAEESRLAGMDEGLTFEEKYRPPVSEPAPQAPEIGVLKGNPPHGSPTHDPRIREHIEQLDLGQHDDSALPAFELDLNEELRAPPTAQLVRENPLINIPPIRTPFRFTTGRQSPDPDRLRRLVGTGRPPLGNFGPRWIACFPVSPARRGGGDQVGLQTGTCEDRLDNNGDGREDARDPVCWDVPGEPQTYNPQLREVNGLFGANVPSPVVNAANPSPTLKPASSSLLFRAPESISRNE